MTRTLTARWVFPVTGTPLAGGSITIQDDRIAAVEAHGARKADVDLGNAAIIPGLVNAHTHLDLSGARGRIPPTSPERFPDWLAGVIAYRRGRTAGEVEDDIEAGLSEALRHGATLIGDISADGGSWQALAGQPVRSVVFRELIGLGEERARTAALAGRDWCRTHPPTGCTRPGLSPHSPYSARQTLLLANDLPCPIAIHLAESPGELELLRSRTGPFGPFLRSLGVWDETGFARDIESILTHHRMSERVLFIHGNYLSPDVARLFTERMSLVYCPRTHAAFRHAGHPFSEFLERGVRVCLGTDSLASNPGLDVLAEARFIHSHEPDFPGDRLLWMATLAGAEALGWADECGSLELGKSADLVVVPLPAREGEAHDLLFSAHEGKRRTMFRGQWRT